MSAPDPGPRVQEQLEALVEWLADPYRWNWTHGGSNRDAADTVLAQMGKIGLLAHTQHPLGGSVWTINGHQFGRVDNGGVKWK